MERRNLSPDRDRQKQIEQSSLDAPFPNRLQELSYYHLRTTNLYLEQARTNEAFTSVLDRQSTRQTEDCSSECKEVCSLPNVWDKGKRQLSPEEEKWLKSRPLDEYGKHREKIANLSSECTRTNPIGIGGMDGSSKGETSKASDERLNEQAHYLYEQACRHDEQKEHDKAKGEYDRAKKLYEDVLADDKWQSTQNPLGMAKAMANLANIYTMECNFDEARIWYKRALPICEQVLEPGHSKIREIRAKMFLGQQVGNYRLTQLLGYGGFGSVYFGKHTHLPNLPGAIKMLNQVYMADQEDKDAFEREAQFLVDLKHENIIPVKEFGVKDDIPYLVMEHATNGTLRGAYPLDPKKPLSPKEVLTLARPIGAALQYMHGMGVVHLDLKPDNVLLGADGKVLLSDFGLAQIIHRTATLRRSELPPVAGTPLYIDPHYIKTKVPHPKHDQYAFGMMIFQWLTGQHWPLRDRARNMQSIPSKIGKIVSRMLEADLDKRYKYVEDAVEDLGKACYGSKWKEQMIQEQVKKLKVENMTLNRDKRVLQERVKNLESEKQALQDKLEREKQALQDLVRDLEQKNSQSGRQESSKSIKGLNRENEIFKDLIKLIDDEKRKEVIQKYYNSGMQDIRDKQYEQAWDNFHRVIALGWEPC